MRIRFGRNQAHRWPESTPLEAWTGIAPELLHFENRVSIFAFGRGSLPQDCSKKIYYVLCILCLMMSMCSRRFSRKGDWDLEDTSIVSFPITTQQRNNFEQQKLCTSARQALLAKKHTGPCVDAHSSPSAHKFLEVVCQSFSCCL